MAAVPSTQELISLVTDSSTPSPLKLSNLYKFYRHTLRPSPTPSTLLDTFLSSFPPSSIQTYHFQQVKLRLADALKRSDLILDLLRFGDRSIIKQAVKLPWLYTDPQGLFSNSTDFLLNNVFPTISHSCRSKMVNKMGRVIGQSGKNSQMIDTLFDALQSTYGLSSALPLLHCCTRSKVETFLTSTKISDLEFTHSQFFALTKKFPDLSYLYLTQYWNHYSKLPHDFQSSYLHLLDKDATKFINFLSSCSNLGVYNFWSLPLGRKRCRRILKIDSQIFSRHFPIINSIFALTGSSLQEIWKGVTREEYVDLFSQSLPKNLAGESEFYRIWKWLQRKVIPQNLQLEVLRKAFSKKYGTNDLTDPAILEHFPTEFVVLLPPEERLKVVEWNIENKKSCRQFENLYDTSSYYSRCNDTGWFLYKPIDVSIPQLKKKLNSESLVYPRTETLKSLLGTAWVNQVNSVLDDLLNLVGDRIRNDQPEVRAAILSVCSHIFVDGPLTTKINKQKWEITKGHWDVMMDMIRLSLLYKEFNASMEAKRKLLDQYIIFLFDKIHTDPTNFGLSDLEPLAQLYIKLRLTAADESSEFNYWVVPSGLKKVEDQQKLVEMYLTEMEKNFPLGSIIPANGIRVLRSILKTVLVKNNQARKKSQKNFLSIHRNQGSSWLVQRIEEILEMEDGAGKTYDRPRGRNRFYNTIHAGPSCELQRKQILQCILDDPGFFDEDQVSRSSRIKNYLTSFYCEPLLTHYLQSDLRPLIENFDEIVRQNLGQAQFKSEMSDDFAIFVRKLQSLGYIKLVEKVVDYCVEILNDPNQATEQQKSAIRLLSIWSSPKGVQKFLEIVSKFYPTQKRLDVLAEGSESDLELKTVVAQSFINLNVRMEDSDLSSKIFSGIFTFCQGDFLKLISGTLYSQVYHGTLKSTLHFLQSSLKEVKAVSVKKHFIRLFFKISSLPSRLATARSMWFDKEGGSDHVTIRYEIFRQLIGFACTLGTQGEESWILLQSAIGDLRSEDKLCLTNLWDSKVISNLPPQYLSSYVRQCLVRLKEIKADEQIALGVSTIDSQVHLIEEDVLQWIIENQLWDFKGQYYCDQFCGHQSSFYVPYLMAEKGFGKDWPKILERRVPIVQKMVTKFIEEEWEETKKIEYNDDIFYPVRTSLSCFVLGLCKIVLEKVVETEEAKKEEKAAEKAGEKEGVQKILGELLRFFETNSVKCFKQILDIRLTLHLLEVNGKSGLDLAGFGEEAGKLVDETVGKYGGEVVEIISKIFKSFLNSNLPADFKTTEGFVEIVDGILDKEGGEVSIHRHIVAVHLFPRGKVPGGGAVPGAGEVKKFEEIRDKIRRIENPVSKIVEWNTVAKWSA